MSLVINKTPSIPYKLCLQFFNVEPKKGDLCAIDFRGKKLLKYLVGTEGSKIRNINDVIFVDGKRIGRAEKSKFLTPVKNGEIPAGQAFLAGTHLDSLDSRYKEFGLVKISDIRGKIIGLTRF